MRFIDSTTWRGGGEEDEEDEEDEGGGDDEAYEYATKEIVVSWHAWWRDKLGLEQVLYVNRLSWN